MLALFLQGNILKVFPYPREYMISFENIYPCVLCRLGWTIPILPELDDLTVGGLVMGTGIGTITYTFYICIIISLMRNFLMAQNENFFFFSISPVSALLSFFLISKSRSLPLSHFLSRFLPLNICF